MEYMDIYSCFRVYRQAHTHTNSDRCTKQKRQYIPSFWINLSGEEIVIQILLKMKINVYT